MIERGPAEGEATVAVVGAGPAGLMAAEVVAAAGVARVVIFERMPSPARKLLLAGRGGLNLTHSEPMPAFLRRYREAEPRLRPAIEEFGPDALRRWCTDLGIATFVGSSGRVFPASFKTSPLLRAWLRRLDALGVRLSVRHSWRGWDQSGALLFETPDGLACIRADAVVLALGGASWPQLGSDGGWVETLTGIGVATSRLEPANCGFGVSWSPSFCDRFEGQPLKRVALSFAGQRSRGDLVVTRAGLEGGAIYPLAPSLRRAVQRDGKALLRIALRPDLPHEALVAALDARRPKQSFSTGLRKALNLSPAAIALLREAQDGSPPPQALDADALAGLINAVPVWLDAVAPLARAISTAGGVDWAAVDDAFMLKAHPGTFVAGEMLDWEAPTGGYLLQACFATGVAAGRGVVARLAAS